MNFANHINLMKNELQNARIQNLSVSPASPVRGQIYFDTTDNRLYAFTDKGWVDLSVANSGNLAGVTMTGTPVIKTDVTKAAGNSIKDAFRVESSTAEALFQVKTNGDTVIGGVLTVNGTGDSTFAGNVNIGGSLHVDGTITTGAKVDLGEDLVVTGNLVVKGNTQLGDNAVEDSTTIHGITKVISKSTKAGGLSTSPAFFVASKDNLPLFQVMENGDANIAGVLTVKAVQGGESGGDTPSMELTGDTVVDNLTVRKDLSVQGHTYLGNSPADDLLIIKANTTIHSKTSKTLGSGNVPAFAIKDTLGEGLFQVMENGDTIIAGVLKVKGTGESEFAGDVKIGGNLTVEGNATVKGLMKGNDFRIMGNLLVDGDTTLGDNAAVDKTKIMGKTTIVSGALKSSGSALINAFEVLSSDSQALFEVRQNGDAIIGQNLKVEQGAIIAANMSGSDLTLEGNLIVKGNTTLGDEATDKITVVGAATFSQPIAMSNKRITGLAEPTQATDAATKNYVDATAAGLNIKDSARAATTTNIALTGLQTIDGIALTAGSRVLVKDQTNKSQNGIYIASAGAWVRSADADNIGGSEVRSGLFTFVEDGLLNSNSGWVLATLNPIIVGSTALTFVQFSGAGSFEAGAGLVKNGNTIDVVGTAGRIITTADTIDIAPNYIGQNTITTLGSVTTGTWNASAISVAKGGTGGTTAVGARSNLGATGKYAANFGDGVASSFTITHGLGSQDIVVSIRDLATNAMIIADITHTTANAIKVDFGFAPPTSSYRVVVVG